MQKAYSSLGYLPYDFPITNKVVNEIISLPMFPGLTKEEITFVTTKIAEFYEKPKI